jgi:hypothetical protein
MPMDNVAQSATPGLGTPGTGAPLLQRWVMER